MQALDLISLLESPYETESRRNLYDVHIPKALTTLKFQAQQNGLITIMPGFYPVGIERCFALWYNLLGYSYRNTTFIEKEDGIKDLRKYLWQYKKLTKIQAEQQCLQQDIFITPIVKGQEAVECDTPDSFLTKQKQAALTEYVKKDVRFILTIAPNRKVGTQESRKIITPILGNKYKWELLGFLGQGAPKPGDDWYPGGAPMLCLVAVRG